MAEDLKDIAYSVDEVESITPYEFKKFIESKKKNTSCILCNYDNLAIIINDEIKLSSIRQKILPKDPNNNTEIELWFFLLVCKNCGFTHFINAQAIIGDILKEREKSKND